MRSIVSDSDGGQLGGQSTWMIRSLAPIVSMSSSHDS